MKIALKGLVFRSVFADGDPPPPPPPNGAATDPELTQLKFTVEQQEFFNKKLADEKRRAAQANEKTIAELEKIKNQVGMTAKQKDELQTQINELKQQSLSKEELTKQEVDKLRRDHANELKKIKDDAEAWQKRYQVSTIERAIKDAAIEHEAFNPAQIVSILVPNTRLDEVKDDDNKPTGNFIPRVKIEEIGEDGKQIVLDLTVSEVLKKMKNTPDRYGNLFKSGVAGGLGQGGNVSGGSNKKVDVRSMTPEQYMEYRKKHPDYSGIK